MTPLEKIRAACIKANPEIVELKFGCFVKNPYRERESIAVFLWKESKIAFLLHPRFGAEKYLDGADPLGVLGRPITLADVLLAIGSAAGENYYSVDVNGVFFRGNKIDGHHWNLRQDNLESQSPETQLFLSELL